MKAISIFLILVAIAWGAFEIWVTAAIGQIAERDYTAPVSAIAWFIAMGPWLLLLGPVLVLLRWIPKIGAVLALVGSLVFIGQAIHEFSGLFSVSFSEDKPLYVILLAIVLLALAATLASLRLLQLVWKLRLREIR